MTTGQDKTISALKFAIQMEIDGKNFYIKSSEECTSSLGSKLLASLAKAEDYHRLKFEQIFDSISRKQNWPQVEFKMDGGKSLRTIFAKETAKKLSQVKPVKTELDAAAKAQEMEAKSYDFYHTRGEQAELEIERGFYNAVAAEEQEHLLILNDYFEYLKSPSDWFTKSERHSLDG